jgi:hypothetical protein
VQCLQEKRESRAFSNHKAIPQRLSRVFFMRLSAVNRDGTQTNDHWKIKNEE